MLEGLTGHPELVTTAVLGGLGINQINAGSRAYQEGDFKGGSEHLLAGNAVLTGLAAVNEGMKTGELGVYTGAQMPFFLAGVAQFLKKHPELSASHLYALCVKAAEKFTVVPALGFNIAIRLWLYENGLIDPTNPLDWVKHLGFTGLSTSFVMPTEGPGSITPLTAKQERFLVTFSARAALTAALGVSVVNSGMDAFASQDLSRADLLALVWMFLNGSALQQDFRTLKKEMG